MQRIGYMITIATAALMLLAGCSGPGSGGGDGGPTTLSGGVATYRSSNLDLSGTGRETVKFDDVKVDERSEYDDSTGEFTAASDGVYQVDTLLSFEAGSFSAGDAIQIEVLLNGSEAAQRSYTFSSEDEGRHVSLSLSKTLFLVNQGGVIEIAVYGAALQNDLPEVKGGGRKWTYLTIDRLDTQGVSAYFTGSKQVGQNLGYAVEFDSEYADHRSEYDTNNGSFTAATEGPYHVDAAIQLDGNTLSAGQAANPSIEVAGTPVAYSHDHVNSESAGDDLTLRLSKTIETIQKGEVLEVRIFNSSSSGSFTMVGNTAGSATYATVYTLSNGGVSAYLDTIQTVGVATTDTVTFNKEVADVNGEFDTSSGTFSAADKGSYRVDAMVYFDADSISAGDQVFVKINRGGDVVAQHSHTFSSEEANLDPSVSLSKTLFAVSQGETVTVDVTNLGGSDLDLFLGEERSYVTIHKVR
jgi:hypothetical protein